MGKVPQAMESKTVVRTAPESGYLRFASGTLPWILGAVMLALYAATLDHWVTMESVTLVAGLQGLDWTTHLLGPITFLFTWPVSWLPAHFVPVAANLLTAVCAAASLGLLARAVAMLPHDLATEPPPQRKGFVPPKLMSSNWAWLPPVFAVAACGLQLTFWENAIAATGQMITLLLFAYAIRCFLEYNCSGKDFWLLRAALAHGLAAANDPFMIFFVPFFILGLFWVKGLFNMSFHQIELMAHQKGGMKLRLFWQIPGVWLAGFSLVLLLPVVAALSAGGHGGFWPAIKAVILAYKLGLAHLPRNFEICACLIGIVPVFLIGLRYYHFLSGADRFHLFVGTAFFQLIYVFFLGVNLWTLFETPLSPHQLAPGTNTLALYFLEALSIGYFLGHFLRTAETPAKWPLGGGRPRGGTMDTGRWLRRGSLALVLFLAVAAPAALVGRSWPEIAQTRANALIDFFDRTVRFLPKEGAVIIGADSTELAYLESDLIRLTGDNCLVLNTPALGNSADYLAFLRRHKHPGYDLEAPPGLEGDAAKRDLIPDALLRSLAAKHEIYSLCPPPLNDYVANDFYSEPHGLVCRLARYETNAAFAPALTAETMRENEAWWRDFRSGPFTNLVSRINPPERGPVSGLVKRFLNTLKYRPEADRYSLVAGAGYATAINDWGVEIQRAGNAQEAGQYFADALLLNPQSASAQINLQFNRDYQADQTVTIQRPLDTAIAMNKYRDWHYVLKDGEVDDPNFCFMLGSVLAEGKLFRPAIAQLERVKKLSPANADTSLLLAWLFTACDDTADAMGAADDALALSPTNEVALFCKANCQIRRQEYQAAIPLLTQVINANPTNNLARLNRAMACRCTHLFDAARSDYQAVLRSTPDAYAAYYDLAQMDDAEAKIPSAIANYELFLKYAPATVAEVARAQARLKMLKSAGRPNAPAQPVSNK